MATLSSRMHGALENLSGINDTVIVRVRRAYLVAFSLAIIALVGSAWFFHRSLATLQSDSIHLLDGRAAVLEAQGLEALLNTIDRAGTAGFLANVAVLFLFLAAAAVFFEPMLRSFGNRSTTVIETPGMNRHFRELAQLMPHGIMVTDAVSLIEWVNPAFTKLSGYTLAEARGKKPAALLQRDDADPSVIERMRRALGGSGHFSEVILNYSKEGQPYWIQIDCQPLRADDGTLSGFMSVQTDITDHRCREAELQSANMRFRFATNASRVGVWELQTDSQAMWWSDTVYETLDFPGIDCVPTLNDLLSRIHPEDRQHLAACIDAAVENKEMLPTRCRIVRPAGDVRTIDMTATMLPDPHGGARNLIGIAVDVTERLAQEDHERQLQARLNDISRQAGMAEVATGVLHNIGNVLNSLGINLSSAKESLRNLKVDRVEKIGAMFSDHAGRLDKFFADDPRARRIPEYFPILVEHMRETTHAIESNLTNAESFVGHLFKSVQLQQSHSRVRATSENIDVREVLDVACAMQAYRKNIADGSVKIVRSFEQVPAIEMQRHKLLDILGNLVTNAIDAVQQTDDPVKTIHLSTRLKDGGVEISVADSGCGVSKENLERIWEFGFTTKATGHGFGLHSCALAVKELGGNMSVSSEGLGHGACFRIWLPVSAANDHSKQVAA